MQRLLFFSFIFLVTLAVAIPKPDEEQKQRVINKDLSDQEHFINSHHNPAYDHEAFLGAEDAKTFDELSPEESIRRLGLIVDKIDHDKDGFVTHEELKDWIKFTQRRYIRDDIDRQWKTHNPDSKDKITWDEYRNMVYGFTDDGDDEPADQESKDDRALYKTMLKRDRRRWAVADIDGDDALNKDEFASFLHPEETEHMKNVVVLETMEDIDKDKDGKISLSEYIGDMYTSEGEDEEPEWVKNEKEQFSNYRDKNRDGFMDMDEARNWILPPDFDHAEAESRHLIYEADTDADQKLTKYEILEKYDIFVGSQVADFGEALTRHDEF